MVEIVSKQILMSPFWLYDVISKFIPKWLNTKTALF